VKFQPDSGQDEGGNFSSARFFSLNQPSIVGQAYRVRHDFFLRITNTLLIQVEINRDLEEMSRSICSTD